ncbi:uncharacterized protein LOC120824395 isoform X10 [Gasterosteus aculeatus]
MLYKYFKMWTFILIGLNIISMVYGYASGYFPETCGTMLPLHDADPQTSKPPYEVSYQQGHVRDPITVCLSSPTGKDFMGFMLKALDTSKEEGPPLGKFTLLDSGLDQLLTCSGSGEGSAVSHKNNRRKTRICVNWTAPQDAGASTTFRATFSETYKTFWTKVDAILPPPTPIPSTLPSTQPSTATSTQPSTATSAQPSTATSAPSSTQPGTSTSTQPSATTSTQPSTATSAPPSTHPGTSTSTQPSTTTSAKPSTHPGTSTSTQPSTTTSAKPSTQPGTATSSPPSTQPGTSTSTQPSATTSTQPSTTTSTHPATSTSTQTSTTTSPHPGTSKSTTISTKPITIITSTATQQADNISSLLEVSSTTLCRFPHSRYSKCVAFCGIWRCGGRLKAKHPTAQLGLPETVVTLAAECKSVATPFASKAILTRTTAPTKFRQWAAVQLFGVLKSCHIGVSVGHAILNK